MDDEEKTRDQLIQKLRELRSRISRPEKDAMASATDEETSSRYKAALFETLVHSSRDGILVVDADGKKVFQNQRTIDLWKIPRHIVDDENDEVQVQHVMHLTRNPEQFVEKIVYLYSHPDETSRDEVALTDGTVLDRYSAPVFGEDGHYYGRIWTFHDITDRKRAEDELRQAFNQIKTLRGIVPICANCKKIRNDKGYWQQVELYIREHTEAEFSHSICPDCMKKLYPELAQRAEEDSPDTP